MPQDRTMYSSGCKVCHPDMTAWVQCQGGLFFSFYVSGRLPGLFMSQLDDPHSTCFSFCFRTFFPPCENLRLLALVFLLCTLACALAAPTNPKIARP